MEKRLKNEANKTAAKFVQQRRWQDVAQMTQRPSANVKVPVPPQVYRPGNPPATAMVPARLSPRPLVRGLAGTALSSVQRKKDIAQAAVLIQRSLMSEKEKKNAKIVADHKEQKMAPYKSMLSHLAGDATKDKKDKIIKIDGGHIWLEVKKRFPNARVSVQPDKTKSWCGYWTNDPNANPVIYKWSTFFPSTWTNDDVLRNVVDIKIDFEKKGDTFYPTGFSAPSSQPSNITFPFK